MTRNIGLAVVVVVVGWLAGCEDGSGNTDGAATEGIGGSGGAPNPDTGGGAGTSTPMAGSTHTGGGAGASTPTAGSAPSGGGAGASTPTAGTAPAGGSGGMTDAGAGGSTPSVNDGKNPNAVNPYPGFKSSIYEQDKMWMCKPGLAKNYCLENIADATESLPDGTFQPFMDDLRTDHPIDCLFWYPTVNRTEEPTSLDFSDPEPMLSSVRSQAARFSRVCNVYAPFYRQNPLNTMGRMVDPSRGFNDVVEGFKHYIANWSEGRNFIIFGHSQGTGHATRLINQEVNGNEDLRKRLVSALLIGGGVSATTFSNIPLCKEPTQFGCVVAFATYGAPQSLSSVMANSACTNPGALGGGKAMMKGSFFRASGTNYQMPLGPEFTASWGLFRNRFTAECVKAPSGGEVLVIDYVPGDMRKMPVDLTTVILFGLHVFDYQFPLDDMIELVRSQRDAKLTAAP